MNSMGLQTQTDSDSIVGSAACFIVLYPLINNIFSESAYKWQL